MLKIMFIIITDYQFKKLIMSIDIFIIYKSLSLIVLVVNHKQSHLFLVRSYKLLFKYTTYIIDNNSHTTFTEASFKIVL